MHPNDQYSSNRSKAETIQIYGNLKLITRFRLNILVDGFSSDTVEQFKFSQKFEAFSRIQISKSFPRIDVIKFPTAEEVGTGKFGAVSIRLLVATKDNLVSYHIKLGITGFSGPGPGSVPYEDEIVGLTTLDQAKNKSVFEAKVTQMLDDAAIFIADKI